jgi:hypothetical protein
LCLRLLGLPGRGGEGRGGEGRRGRCGGVWPAAAGGPAGAARGHTDCVSMLRRQMFGRVCFGLLSEP